MKFKKLNFFSLLNQPEENILDQRLIEHYHKKIKEEPIKKDNQKDDKRKKNERTKVDERTEASEDERSEDEAEKIDKRTLDKLAKLCKDETKVKLISSNSSFRLEPDESAGSQRQNENGDELNKSTNDKLNDSLPSIDLNRTNSDLSAFTDIGSPKSSSSPINRDPITPFSISKETDALDSISNDSTLCDDSNDDLAIDSGFFGSSKDLSIERQNGNETSFGNLKRKFDSIEPDSDVNNSVNNSVNSSMNNSMNNSDSILAKFNSTKEHHHLDLVLARQVTNVKANQVSDQALLKKSSPYSDQRSENLAFSLNSSQFNGNKNEFSFQDHHRSSDANNNKMRSYKPEFLKKKTNLLDQVVITDVTANNTTITVRESKSQKFFFKDSKKTASTNGGHLQI